MSASGNLSGDDRDRRIVRAGALAASNRSPSTWFAAVPPILTSIRGQLVLDRLRNELGVRPSTTSPSELPELLGSAVILVDRGIDVAHRKFALAVSIDRDTDVVDEVCKTPVVVRGDAFGSGPPLAL